MKKGFVILFIIAIGVVLFGQAEALKNVPNVDKKEMGLIDPKTGKPIDPSEYEISSVKEIDRRFIPDYDEKAQASFDGLEIFDESGKKVELKLDRVTLIEYWSKTGNLHNKFWKRARELEKKYSEETGFQLLSINHDPSFNTPERIGKISKFLASNGFEKPQKLYFDLNDTFRDKFYVFGPVIYLLIDNRGQLTNGGRGDFARTEEEVFAHIENALKNFHKDGLRINEKK